MTQQPSQQVISSQGLVEALQALSAREQIGLLVRATRPLSGRERVEVWRVAGFSVLRDRFLPILLHILLKRVLAGALWWGLCTIAVVAVLLVLVFVEQLNPNAVTPVLTTLVSFFIGFSLFALVDFARSLAQFFGKTCSRSTREELLARLNASEHAARLALLRVLSASLARKVPGESILASIITGLVLFLASAILLGLALLLSNFLPVLGNFPWVVFVAGIAFLLGLWGPGMLQHRLAARKAK